MKKSAFLLSFFATFFAVSSACADDALTIEIRAAELNERAVQLSALQNAAPGDYSDSIGALYYDEQALKSSADAAELSSDSLSRLGRLVDELTATQLQEN